MTAAAAAAVDAAVTAVAAARSSNAHIQSIPLGISNFTFFFASLTFLLGVQSACDVAASCNFQASMKLQLKSP